MTFGKYIYSDNTQQTRQAAINQIIDSADKLEAGHLKAVENASALYQSIAALPFNETEEPLRQELVNDVKTVIEDNTQYGNMYPALDKILKYSGELLTRKDVTSAIRNQATYKAFIDDIDKRQDIPLGMKEFYKEKNPYNRVALTNNNSETIGFKDWQISYQPTSHFDGTAIVDKAIQRLKPIGNTTQRLVYRDAAGNEVSSTNPSAVEIAFYNTITQQYESVSADRLFKEIISTYNEDPTVRNSILQEIEWIKWMREKGDTSDYGLYDNNGHIKELPEYLKWKFMNTANATAWYKNLYSIDAHRLGNYKTDSSGNIIEEGGGNNPVPTNNVSGNAAGSVSVEGTSYSDDF